MITIGSGVAAARQAAEAGAVAVIVDALRSSASLCAAIQAGVEDLLVCPSADVAFELAKKNPNALIAGEWNSTIPDGFNFDNSPQDLSRADLSGKTMIFTSSNGARMLCAAGGAKAVYTGSVVNAARVVGAMQEHAAAGDEIVIIAAGEGDQECDEDSATAALLAVSVGPDINKDQENLVTLWMSRIADVGLESIFLSTKHGEELAQRGKRDDVAFCARPDAFSSLPRAVEYIDFNDSTIVRLAG